MKADIYLFLATLLIVISLIMAVFNRKKNKNILYLSLFLVILGIEGILSWYFYTEHSDVTIFAVFLNHFAPLYTLKAPLLFFFVRGNIRDDYRLSPVDYLHFIPAVIHLILVVPYALLPFSEKIEIAQFIKSNLHLYVYTDLHYPYPHIWNQYFRAVQLVVYSMLSMVLLIRFRKITLELPESLRSVYRFTAVWMMFLLIAFLLVGLLQLTMVIQPATADNALQALANVTRMFRLSLVLYALIPIILLAYPKFMYGFPSFRLVDSENKIISSLSTGFSAVTNYSTQIFGNLDTLYAEVRKLILTQQLFLNPELKVSDVSELMNVPAYQLVLCLSIKAEKSFDEFLNENRVKYLIDTIKKQPDNQDYDSLWKMSGFNSADDFDRVFRKVTGFTYRNWYSMNFGYKPKL